ncbi:MAG: hypothetical protein ACKVOE_01150 [Rickettsiales bacterium]
MRQLTKTTATLLAALVLMSACETIEGFGRDTSKLGNNIAGAAESVKK